MIKVKINGDVRELPENVTLAEAVSTLGMPNSNIVAVLNGTVIKKGDFAHSVLNNGDCLELVRFVGGG